MIKSKRSISAVIKGGLLWPLLAIDFEASSLEADSYPIEVGLALWPSPNEQIFSWSSLIRPTSQWHRSGHWNWKSAAVHGISMEELLTRGSSTSEVAAALNLAVGSGNSPLSDNLDYDSYWATRLFQASGITPNFTLGDWHKVLSNLTNLEREQAHRWFNDHRPSHRARSDAEGLLLALAYAIAINPGTPCDFITRLPALEKLAVPATRKDPG